MLRDTRRCSGHLRGDKFRGKKSALSARPIHRGATSSYWLTNVEWSTPRYAVRNGVQAQHYFHIAVFDCGFWKVRSSLGWWCVVSRSPRVCAASPSTASPPEITLNHFQNRSATRRATKL
jgi:hypothetical protein